MPGPLIRPPTKKQVVIGAIAAAVAIGLMGLAGSTGRLASEVQEERQREAAAILASQSATPVPTAAPECLGVITDLTNGFIAAQDALREAAQGGDFSQSDLDAASDEAKKVEDKGLTDCEDADPDTAMKVHDAIDAVQAAAKADLTEENAQGFLDPVVDVLELAA